MDRKIGPAEGILIQRELSPLVDRKWDKRKVERIAGADVHFPARDQARAALAVFSFPGLELIETAVHQSACLTPYIPGLLSFREIPAILKAWKKLQGSVSLLLCDSHGIAHPRRLGMASHLGLILDIPTIGCAKSPLCGIFEEPGPERGDRAPIRDKEGFTIGTVLRTRQRVKPIYVSIGHKIDLVHAVQFVLASTPRYRISTPLRWAHRLAGSRT
ncbi:MAG: endonuclease V [Candidatus Krumholzibacteriota bacterium]|nr:endonuclease V [Candidatus Krumholzibacteriota bacterium]